MSGIRDYGWQEEIYRRMMFSFLDSLLLAVGLAMDCFAVSVATGIGQKTRIDGREFDGLKRKMAVCFGVMQMLMPVVTIVLGQYFADVIGQYNHWVSLVILTILGGKMIVEDLRGEDGDGELKGVTAREIMFLGVATSIDALSVGLLFVTYSLAETLVTLGLIGLASYVLSVVGMNLGKKFGAKMEGLHAGTIGGVILVVIGIKIMIMHYV